MEGTGLLAVEAAWAGPGKAVQAAGTLQIDLVAAALEVAEAAIARFCTEAAAVEAASIVVEAVASAFAEAEGGRALGPRGPLMRSPPVERLAEPHWPHPVAVAAAAGFSASKRPPSNLDLLLICS